MPVEAIVAALLSALIHASWNATLKSGVDRLIDVGIMGLGGIVLGIFMIAWGGWPAPAAWPYLAGSAVVHVVYWSALNRSYSFGDMSHVYTIARGMAPLLVTIGALLTAREIPSGMALAGIVLISAGIAVIGFSARAPARATAWAALTGVSIASYSLVDALGIRSSGSAASYIGVSSIGTFAPMCAYCMWKRGIGTVVQSGRGRWHKLMLAGAMTNAGFGLALWAQTIAPIAYVTALRETSVVFGAAIATFGLKEVVGRRRWAGAIVVAIGSCALLASRS